MRYRPFARAGMAVSVLSLALDGGRDGMTAVGCRKLMHAAFEAGINAFELIRPTSALLQGAAEGVAAVPRHLLFMALRIAWADDEARLAGQVGEVIARTGLGHFDLLNLEAAPAMSAGPPPAMLAAKHQGLVRRLGVAGESELLTEHLEAGGFDALVTSFNILSGWRERHMVRTAMEKQVAVIGCDPWPARAEDLAEAAAAKTRPGWFSKRQPLAGVGSYAFLARTPGWSAEQLCLGYALTEPALASVQVSVEGPEHLASLAETAERDLPAGASAQIEMARFSAELASGARRHRQRRTA